MRPLLLALVAAILFGLGTALAFDTYRQYQAKVIEAKEMADTARRLSLKRTSMFLKQSSSLLVKLSDDMETRGRVVDHCLEVLAELMRTQSIYTNLVTLDASGRVLCDAKALSQGQASGPDLANDFLQVARTGQFTVGKPAQNASSERWISRLLVPIKDNAGALTGALALSMDLLNLDLTGSPGAMGQELLIGIVNGDGTIVARSEGGMLRIGRPANSDVAKTVLREREGSARGLDYLGSDRLFSFAPVPDSDWILFASVDLHDIVAPVIQLALKRFAAFAVLLLAAVGVVVLWRRNAHPKPG